MDLLREIDAASAEGGTRALDRGLRLLALLAERQPRNLSELAAAAGLAKSTTHRLLATLAHRGVVQEVAKGGYRLAESSPWLVGWIPAAQFELDWVRAETGETANFGMLVGTEIQYVARALSDHALRWGVEVGSRVPTYCSGMGKAVLAFRPDVQLEPAQLVMRTPRTVTTLAALGAQLAEVRSTGYAIDEEEFLPGVCCLAVPVLGGEGKVVGAISVSGPTIRFDVSVARQHAQLLRAAAANISQNLGVRGSFPHA